MEKEDFEELVNAIEASTLSDKDKAEKYFELGELIFEEEFSGSGYFGDAIDSFSRAIDYNAQEPKYHFMQGKALFLFDMEFHAIEPFTNAIKLQSNNPEYYYWRGLAHLHVLRWAETAEDLKDALDDFDKLTELNPSSGQGYYERANAFKSIQEYEKALEELNSAIKIERFNLRYIFDRGLLHGIIENYEEALSDFNLVLTIHKKDPVCLCERGKTFYFLNQYKKALSDFNKAISIKCDNDMFYFWRGLTYCSVKDFQNAVEDFNTAIKLDGAVWLYYFWMGLALFETKKINESIKSFSRAIELDEKEEILYYHRGHAYYTLHQTQKALEDFTFAKKGGFSSFTYEEKQLINLHDVCKNKSASTEIFETLKLLLDKTIEIRNKKSINSTQGRQTRKKVYHYTKNSTVKYLFHNEKTKEKRNKSLNLRMSNAVYMNDPTEGSFFVDVLSKNCSEVDFFKSLYAEGSTIDSGNTYLASFSKAEAQDILPMWSMYSNDGSGCCIEIPLSSFSNIKIKENEFPETLGLNSLESSPVFLFEVSYIDIGKIQKKDIDDFNSIKKALLEIDALIKDINQKTKEAVYSLIRDILDSIRFLYKSKAYEHEQEVRVVGFEDNKDNIFLSEADPISEVPKLYINLDCEIKYEDVSVIIGPKVPKPLDVSTYLQHVGVKEVRRSNIKYR